MKARRLASKINATTQWPVETWVLHDDDNPGGTHGQVEIFRHAGTWYAWTSSIVDPTTKAHAIRLATQRNASDDLSLSID